MYKKSLMILTLIITSVLIVLGQKGQSNNVSGTEMDDTQPTGWPVIDLGTPAIRDISYPCYVKIELVDAESSESTAGLIRFFTENVLLMRVTGCKIPCIGLLSLFHSHL